MMRIGIDFDNTIAGYDEAFVSLAREWGLEPATSARTKTELRNALRQTPDGETDWQKLQGRIYGAEMNRAILIDGVGHFLSEARNNKADVFIVSHKTEYGHHDAEQTNLRHAATDWMNRHRFFEPDGFAIASENLFFEDTREAKLGRITALTLDWFIDDLPEVLNDPAFPGGTEKILFSNQVDDSAFPFRAFSTWREIEKTVFQ